MSEIAHIYQIKCKTNGKIYECIYRSKSKDISLREFCKVFGISDATVKSRLQRGISLLDALTEPSNTNRGEINKEVIYVGSN